MARDPSLLSSNSPLSIAPANPYIVHVQLRDLLICPKHQGVVNYIADHAIVEQDLHAKAAPFRVLSELKFAANSLTSLSINESDTLVAAGGQEAELHLSYLSSPSSSQPSSSSHSSVVSTSSSANARRSRLRWDYSTRLSGTINNSILLTSLSLTTSHLSSVEPRVGVSNNDGSVKLYDVPMRVQNSTRTARGLHQVGAVRLDVPINHSSISPDGRTLLSVGDSSKVYFHRIGGSSSQLTFTPITTLTIPTPEFSSSQYGYGNYPNSLTASFSTAFSHDGSKFAVASQEGVVAVWDVRLTSKPLKIFSTDREREPGSNYERMMNSNLGASSGWLSDDPWEWTRGTRAPGWCVRSVKFNNVSPSGIGGFGGREIMAFTEHTDLVHVVDARTFEGVEVVRVPMIGRKGKSGGRMRMDGGGGGPGGRRRRRRRRAETADPSPGASEPTPSESATRGEGTSAMGAASVSAPSTFTASTVPASITAARLRRMERLAERRGLVDPSASPSSAPDPRSRGFSPRRSLSISGPPSAPTGSRPNLAHTRSQSDIMGRSGTVSTPSSGPFTSPSAWASAVLSAHRASSSPALHQPTLSTPPRTPTSPSARTRPTSPSSPGAYSAPASIGDSTWRTLDNGIPITVAATGRRVDTSSRTEFVLREAGTEVGLEAAREMDTEMDTPTTMPSLHALARYVLDDDEAEASTARSAHGPRQDSSLAGQASDNELAMDWREILATNNRELADRADVEFAAMVAADTLAPSGHRFPVARNGRRRGRGEEESGGGGDDPEERETEPIASRMRRIRMQERALRSGFPLIDPTNPPNNQDHQTPGSPIASHRQLETMRFATRETSLTLPSSSSSTAMEPMPDVTRLQGQDPAATRESVSLDESTLPVWGTMFQENLRQERTYQAEARARAERGEVMFDVDGNLLPRRGYGGPPEAHFSADDHDQGADVTDHESEEDWQGGAGQDRNTGSTTGDYEYPLFGPRRGSSVGSDWESRPGFGLSPRRRFATRAHMRGAYRGGVWIPGRSVPLPGRLEEEDEDEAHMDQDDQVRRGLRMDVDEDDSEEDGDETDRPIALPPTNARTRLAVPSSNAEADHSDDDNDYALGLFDEAERSSEDDSIDYGGDDDEEYDGWYEDGAYYSTSSYHAPASPNSSIASATHNTLPNPPPMTYPDDLDIAGLCFDPWGERMYVAGVKSAHMHPHHSPHGGPDSPGIGPSNGPGVRGRGSVGIGGPRVGHSSFAASMVFGLSSPVSPGSADHDHPQRSMAHAYGGGGIGIGGTGDMGLGPGVVVEWGVRGAEKRFWVDEGWM